MDKLDNTTVASFTMTAYIVMDRHKFVPFSLFFLLYIITISWSVLLISVIYQHKDLHQPMYLFVCNLAINGLYGSTGLLPTTLILLLSQTYEIIVPWCLTQVFLLHTYASVEYTILAIMSYDRYVAISYPLQYHSIMSPSRICKLIALAWLYPFIIFLMYFSFTLPLMFCKKRIQKLFCVNIEVVRNSCTSTTHINIMGLVCIAFLIMPQILMIIFSYVQILKVCHKLSKESQAKALKTCIPHLLSVVNYSIGAFFEIIQSRFDMSHTSDEVRIFLSLYYVLIPPIINPALYGIGTQAIRVYVFKICSSK